ncbi:sporulation integral membrane protein YlbJ [Tissierella sp. Yu-01]|uniref:sporulation integral membrane protein YlbJ n=1 Tax=Tissierella sp. Yu-01 TaxID=3035694 RepID=UPI00240D2161|nr:sporulation integral membrane protein YlbJ [Tissierella sp. Yu-01]WFA09797.1 sporulation integral membrane protein YlbJ [Tissierella sp. Yu-01]
MYNKKTNKINLLVTIVLLIIMFQVVKNPSQSIKSAREGLNLWFNLLLPSLFPFIFITDLLVSFGFVDFISRYLESFMRPIFNVPGIGIFPFSMSIMSGYPVGARLTAKLRELNLISKTVGNRLISFSSTSGPLFILGTVLIGMVGAPKLSGLMIIPHYMGALSLGLIFRFYKRKNSTENEAVKETKVRSDLFIVEIKNKSIGSLIAKSVKDSMESIIIVGGFVIIYSVIIDILLLSPIFISFIDVIAHVTSINSEIIMGTIAGIIEITKGCEIISKLDIEIISKVILLNFIIGWGGFSIHSQALSFISSTDISSKIYLLSKASHGLLSAIYTYIIYKIAYKDLIIQTYLEPIPVNEINSLSYWLELFKSSTFVVISIIVFLILLSILTNEVNSTKRKSA